MAAEVGVMGASVSQQLGGASSVNDKQQHDGGFFTASVSGVVASVRHGR